MTAKTAYYAAMAEEAAKQVTGSRQQWTAFLTTAARLYKYPFHEQLMIYRQRPDATACAEYDLWNNTMRRYVKRGSKGIALVDTSGDVIKLRYVFDVSDTGERSNSRPVNLWQMKDEYVPAVIEDLGKAFDISGAETMPLPDVVEKIAGQLAGEYWEDHREQILSIVDDSFLYGYDEDNVRASFRRAAETSIQYMLLSRCTDDAESYFIPEDFMDVFDFNTQAAVNVLGTAVSEVSGRVLREIERTIRTCERSRTEERSQDNGRTDVHEERGLPDSGHHAGAERRPAPGQVREDAQDVSAGAQHAAVQSPDPHREAVSALAGDSGRSGEPAGADHGRASEAEPRAGQEDPADGLGAPHERTEGAGRGDYSGGTDQQLSIFFPSEEEQSAGIDAAERAEASQKAPAFSMSLQSIYEKFYPVMRDLLLEDTAYRNACANSDPENARLEGNAAVQRAALTIQDPDFMRLYFDSPEDSARLRDSLVEDTFRVIASENVRGNPDYFRYFYDYETAETQSFLEEHPGWHMVWGSESAGLNGDMWVVYRDESDLPRYLRDYALTQRQADERKAARQTSESKELEAAADSREKAEPNQERESGEKQSPSDRDSRKEAENGAQQDSDAASTPDSKVQNQEERSTEDNPPTGGAAEILAYAERVAAETDVPSYERFQVIETDNGYVLWDDIRDEIYVEDNGDTRTFLTREEAETYQKSVKQAVEARQAQEWLYIENAKNSVEEPSAGYSYAPGDTVFLDGNPFEVEQIGLFDVQLRDLTTLFPIFRAENRENFEAMLWSDARNAQYLPKDAKTAETTPNMEITASHEEAAALEPQLKEAGIDTAKSVHEDGSVTFSFQESDRKAVEELANRLREPEPERKQPEELKEAKEPNEVSKEQTPEPAEPDEESPAPESARLYSGEKNGMPFDVVVQRLHVEEPAKEQEQAQEQKPVQEQQEQRQEKPPEIPAVNFRITDDHLGEGGAKTKFRANMDAIHTLQRLEAENRNATPEEQQILSKFVGWGGLADAFDEKKSSWASEYKELKEALTDSEYAATRASTLNAHYTSPTVIRAIYDALEQMGFQGGNILEPSMGVGNFFGMLPDSMQDSRLYGVELDSISGRIAQKLYPRADIKVAGFETTDRRDFYDLAVGNVPFGNYRVADKPYDKLGFTIHNYFFAKALDQVRPGGIVAFVTSRFTMDAKNPEVRQYLAKRADLLGAIRLPNNAFLANAGTGVVSDIIFLQKRDRPIEIEPDWVHLGLTPDNMAINSYFTEHPEMVLGKLTTESTQYGRDDVTVEPVPGADLGEQLHEAVSRIQGTYEKAEVSADEILDAKETVPADPSVRNYSFAVLDGEVYFRENSVMRHVDLNETAKGRVTGMVELRRIVGELIDYQMEDYPEEKIREKQQELNAAYDAFYEQYGTINSRPNAQVFQDDSSYYLLCSLENLDEDGQLQSKADMFTRRTIRPDRVITSVDTPSEALAVSIGERGQVDLPYMAELLGTPEEYDAIVQELQGVIFRDPLEASEEDITRGWHTADDYLSGDVREKLQIARSKAASDPSYEVNVSALEKAQPKDLDASEIDVRLGATWIDRKYIQQFMEETFEPPYYMRSRIQVQYSPLTAEWQISGKSMPNAYDVAAYTTYGTSRANAYRILEDTLNLRDVRIYDSVTDPDGKQKRVLNKRETTLAQQKQQAIKDAFRDWVWRDPRRRNDLVHRYNELFNSTRPREYDGSHIQFGGMNPDITLREHQRGAIAHVLYGGNTLLAHEVGAGKTFEMAASAMEAKRLGLCQKSMFVVPNHLTMQWANEFLRLYPSAKILVATKRDFETARRKKFCARIATGNYDAVIIGHSQFEKIPISPERQERLLREQIEEIEAGIAEAKQMRGESFTIKQMEKTRKSLQAKLDKLLAADKKDDVITFEQLGVDRLFVDEAHAFKNLFLFTKMRNVAGLSTSEAQKSSDMFMKCRYMDELTGGRGVIFATGTPYASPYQH